MWRKKEGASHGGGKPHGSLGIAQRLPWVDCLRGGFSLGRRLVSFRAGADTFLGRGGGGLVLRLGAGGLWEGWRYYKGRAECAKDFSCDTVCPVNWIPWLRVVSEPVMCAVESVFEGGPSLHQN